jgi:hypothetical protein
VLKHAKSVAKKGATPTGKGTKKGTDIIQHGGSSNETGRLKVSDDGGSPGINRLMELSKKGSKLKAIHSFHGLRGIMPRISSICPP